MKHTKTIIAALSILVVSAVVFLLSAAATKPEKTATFVTYNVLADPGLADLRVPELLKIIGDCDADVIALQEVAPWFIQRLVKADWFKEYHAPKSDGKIICPRGLLILSKQPITSSDYGLLPSKQRRSYLIVETKVNGMEFKAATCHLDSFLKEGAVRAKQLDIIFKKLSAGDNAIFLGDFNFSDNEQPETKHLDKAYVDAWTKTNPGKKGYTWNIETSEMARKGSFPGEKSRRLDRILIRSKQAKPVSANILGDKPLKGKTDIFPSDHFGLRGIVTIK